MILIKTEMGLHECLMEVVEAGGGGGHECVCESKWVRKIARMVKIHMIDFPALNVVF